MDDAGSQILMDNIVKDHVRPEVERRAREGNPVEDEIWAAQVVFSCQAPTPLVRLNSEVRLAASVVGSAGFEDYVSLPKRGMRQFTSIRLTEEERDIRHLTLCQTSVSSTWAIFFALDDPTLQARPKEGTVVLEAGYKPPTPNEWEELYTQHDRVAEKVLAINSTTPECPIEVLMVVALQRSRHLLQAYVQLAASKNLTAASALIRMQVDSAMRVNACFLVEDPLALWGVLKTGAPWSQVHSRDNQPLSDRYLHQKLTEKFAWATDVYTQMSGYVHLSRPHLQSTVEGEGFLGMVIRQGPAGQEVTDRDLAENARLFTTVTKALLSICEEYANNRSA